MGYVNYVNGVPVSIQLSEADLVANDGVLGRMLKNPAATASNWKQNMLKRNQVYHGGNDAGSVQVRNEM